MPMYKVLKTEFNRFDNVQFKFVVATEQPNAAEAIKFAKKYGVGSPVIESLKAADLLESRRKQ